MKKLTKTALAVSAALFATAAYADCQVEYQWNADKVVLPSSQWTPDQPYEAQVWVVNTGKRYEGPQGFENPEYNHIWGIPAVDADGHNWYDIDYVLTSGRPEDGEFIEWQTATSPFSSDEYYKDHKSFQWITGDIMGDIYMRRTFTVEESNPEARYYLACGRDDAPSEWYINGVLVHSVNEGWNNDDRILLTAEQQALIKTDGSENLIAVHVHQNWGGAFADCGLYRASMITTDEFLSAGAGDAEPWPCAYKLLANNEDITTGDAATWAALDLDEEEWIKEVGPFSNSEDMFRTTYWDSENNAILIRRHFTLTSANLQEIALGKLTLFCSYDEEPKVYLNGKMIWSHGGWNDNRYDEYRLTADDVALLVEGDNVLAVSLQKGGGGGHIDYALKYESIDNEAVIVARAELASLIELAKATFPETTGLAKKLAEAEEVLSTDMVGVETMEMVEKMKNLINEVRRAGVDIYNYGLTLELMEGIDVSEAERRFDEAVSADGFAAAIRELRYERRRAAAERHTSKFKGSAPAEGNFYIYNVGQRQFLSGGSDWGTHAALNYAGVEVTLIAEDAEQNKYYIDTHLFNGEEQHYLNYRGYVDCPLIDDFQFVPVEGKENVYYIVQADYPDAYMAWNPYASVDGNQADETTVGTENRNLDPANLDAQWMLVSRAEREAMMAEASIENPVDATFFIASPGFNQRENAESVWQLSGASIWEYGNNHNDFVAESWNTDNCDINQMVMGLPAGVYTAAVQGYYRNGDHAAQASNEWAQNAVFYAGDDINDDRLLPNILTESYMAPGEGDNSVKPEGGEYQIPNSCVQATNYFKAGLYKVHTTVLLADGVDLVIGVSKEVKDGEGDWVVVDNFRLTYWGTATTKEAVEEYLATGIGSVEADSTARPTDNRVFNLQGIQVQNPTAPGIYIQNGKKFVIK